MKKYFNVFLKVANFLKPCLKSLYEPVAFTAIVMVLLESLERHCTNHYLALILSVIASTWIFAQFKKS